MQENNKKQLFKNIRKAINNINLRTKKMSFILVLLIIVASCIMTVTIAKMREGILRASAENLLEYEITKRVGESEYEILIKIHDKDGLEYVKCPDGDILYANGRETVGMDYNIFDEVSYDFKIKVNGKDEKVETIYKKISRIEGSYELVNGVYLNIPDFTGFETKYTRYLNMNENGNMIIGNWITDESNNDWYDYKNSKWANVYVESNGAEVYYVWIPRYCFKLNQEKQRSDVKFIDTLNNYIDENGNKTTWNELKEQGYQVPQAFDFNDIRIPGYWSMKYTAGDVNKPSTINYDISVSRGVMTIRNITLNATIINKNPIVKYTIALNGKIIQTIDNEEELLNINSQVIEVKDMVKEENVINVTGVNENGEVVGSMTKLYIPAVANEPELESFNKDTTFYVTYDDNGNENSTVPITEKMPDDWYEYGESRWANIVTRNNGLEIYYTWIPRYEFTLDQINERSIVKFIKGTAGKPEKAVTSGYQIPEAFEFNGQQISGYWAMKYTVGNQTAPKFDTEIVATNNSIRTKGIKGTAIEEGQVYKYYINGQYKGEEKDSSKLFEYTGLDSNTKYTILVEIRDSATDNYIGTIVKQISTINTNSPALTVFNTKRQIVKEINFQ